MAKALFMKFEEMSPFFLTEEIPEEAMQQHVKNYMKTHRSIKDARGKNWSGVIVPKAVAVCFAIWTRSGRRMR